MKKFFFHEKDNIYRLFEVLDKLPKKYKEVIFDIDSKNDFFSNQWWLKLVLEKAKDKQVKIIFVIENSKQEDLMKLLQANYIWRKTPLYKKVLKQINSFLDIFKSHDSFYRKHYSIFKFLFIGLEVLFVFFVFYFIYNLITPKTDIYIQPAVKVKHLVQKYYLYPEEEQQNYEIPENKDSLPYKNIAFSKTYTLKIPVKDISYIAKPAEGIVKIVNTTTEGFSLKARTQLITDDGLIFRLQNWIYVPPKDKDANPGIAYVKVKADEKDKNGKLIGIRGNLTKGTKLYIRKLYLSYAKKKIYAEAKNDFSGGDTNPFGQVSIQDIQILKEQLLKEFKKQLKKNILRYIQANGGKYIPLFYEKLYGMKDIKYYIYAKPGDNIPYIKGDISASIYFAGILKQDLKDAFKKYLKNRIVTENEFLGWNENSIQLLGLENITDKLFLATFSINALLGYDFKSDYNGIKETIIEEVRGKAIEEAKNIILSYPMVAGVEIKTTNASLNKVSDLKSRIFIHIAK